MNTIMTPLRAPLRQSLNLTQGRTFTTTTPHLSNSTMGKLPKHLPIPPYPYGPSKWYKQSNLGLYGLAKIRHGNIVSEKNEIKTRRHWRPNVHHKQLWSEALGTKLRIRVTTSVLRTIDKVGGLDEYLLGNKPRRIKELGVAGWKLRCIIMEVPKVKERLRAATELKYGFRPEAVSENDAWALLKAQARDTEFEIGGNE